MSGNGAHAPPASIVGERHGQGTGPVVYFATTIPGLGPLLAREVTDHRRLDLVAGPDNDGRSDVVFFHVARGTNPLDELRIAEDVFVLVGATVSDGDAQRLTSRLIRREGLERGLSVWSRFVRPLRAAMTYRTVVRVRSERHFRRTSLRSVVSAALVRHRPRWQAADPSELELWVQELSGSRFVAGVRLSAVSMRQRGGRALQRRGALRPAVAAAMVTLAGTPDGILLDPFCGAGTILAEAVVAGWRAVGADIDDAAVTTARANVPEADIVRGDARELGHSDGSVAAVVANLPFGRQFEADHATLDSALREMGRVARAGGKIVLLLPPPLPPLPLGVELRRHYELRLLGVPTTIWQLDHVGGSRAA